TETSPAKVTPTILGVIPIDDAWLAQVASMPAEKQVAEVKARLKERNHDFDGNVNRVIEEGVVRGLDFLTDNVTDIAPVQGLRGLRSLKLNSKSRHGKLAVLAP